MGRTATADRPATTTPATTTTEDGATRYLRAIGAVHLLSAEQELALAQRVRQGDQAARQQFIAANLRLTVYIAKRYLHRGLDFDDLVQEGNLGLLEAVDRFDPERGVRFAHYAVHWIAKGIRDYLTSKAPAMPLPKDARRDRATLRAAEDRLLAQEGRLPALAELCQATGISLERARYLLSPTTDTPLSLDTPLDAEGTALGAALADATAADPADAAERADQRRLVLQLVDRLNARERQVIVGRYLQEQTREALGRQLGVTAQRVAQIEQRALLRLQLAAAA